MTTKENFWTNADVGKLILRVTLGGLIFFHGWHKVLHGIGDQTQMLAGNGIPGFLMFFAYSYLKFLAPVLIVLGAYSRACRRLSIVITLLVILVRHPGSPLLEP